MSNKNRKIVALSTGLILATPLTVLANAGLPMIVFTFPLMLMALLPIIMVESFVIQRSLKAPFKKVIVSNGIANVASTLIGTPLAWGILLGFQLITTGGGCGPGFETVPDSMITAVVGSAWICPWAEQEKWLIPIAFINCMIVAFFISVYIEYLVMRKTLKGHEDNVVKKVTYKSNLVSYFLLVVVSVSYYFYSIGVNS